MGFEFAARCSACDYSVGGLTVGDGSHFLFTCRRCRELVTPEQPPFRLTTPDCPRCGVPLPASDALDPTRTSLPILRNAPHADPLLAELMPELQQLDLPPPEDPECPRCAGARLELIVELHFSAFPAPRSLKRGQLVHGFRDAHGQLVLADVGPVEAVFSGRPPPEQPRGPYELEVLAVGRDQLELGYRGLVPVDQERRRAVPISCACGASGLGVPGTAGTCGRCQAPYTVPVPPAPPPARGPPRPATTGRQAATGRPAATGRRGFQRTCPGCGERVDAAARRCPRCGNATRRRPSYE